LVTIQVGRYSAAVYPKVESSMPVYERAHAFQVARTALEPLPVDTRLILDALGVQLNCSSIVDGQIFDWKDFFEQHWCNFQHLVIQSYHNSAGVVIANTSTALNPSILLLVQDGIYADCRKAEVRFVRVSSILINFAPLAIGHHVPGPTILCSQYYIKLPQMTRVLNNGVGVANNLTTWHGVDDLSTLSIADICLLILDVVIQNGPIALLHADFNLGEANIDSNGLVEKIHAKILKLGFNHIAHSIFAQLCPNYSDQPHAALDLIQQSGISPDGQLVTSSVIEFYQCIMNASRPFQSQRTYPVSICDVFIQKLDHRITASFQKNYPAHATTHRLDTTYQRQQLSIILSAAQSAEDEVRQVQDIARSLVGQGQGFFMQPLYGQQIFAYPSQAETTLTQYAGGDVGGRPPQKYWGCGSLDHVWRRARGKILCPKKDDPTVQKRAHEAHMKWVADLKARGGGNRTPRGDKSDPADGGKCNFVAYKDMTDAQKTKMRKDVLAATASTPDTKRAPSGPTTVFFMRSIIPILVASSPPARRVLPVPVQTAFPHLTIQLGSVLGDDNCPAARCVIDIVTALTVGNDFHFFAEIAKAYPHCVAAIYSHADYTPIVLSGIVQHDGVSVTSDLTVAFKFHQHKVTRQTVHGVTTSQKRRATLLGVKYKIMKKELCFFANKLIIAKFQIL
jgi:hypothetical protein